MPKPIINNFKNSLQLEATDIFNDNIKCKNPELTFRKQRPKEYLDILKDLDLYGENIPPDKIKDIVENIKKACPEVILEDSFVGILSKCMLGAYYDVHTISINKIFGIDEVTHLPGYGRLILKHYKKNEQLPKELEKARTLASNSKYAFVEVYNTKIIAVDYSGATAIIET